MQPHPAFAGSTIPCEAEVGGLRLRTLRRDDVEEDFRAVMETAARLRRLSAGYGGSWPEGLTLERNLLDLAWHEREFSARRSFAWTIREGGAYLGCAYLMPRWEPGTANAVHWFREGEEARSAAFGPAFHAWVSAPPFPSLALRTFGSP